MEANPWIFWVFCILFQSGQSHKNQYSNFQLNVNLIYSNYKSFKWGFIKSIGKYQTGPVDCTLVVELELLCDDYHSSWNFAIDEIRAICCCPCISQNPTKFSSNIMNTPQNCAVLRFSFLSFFLNWRLFKVFWNISFKNRTEIQFGSKLHALNIYVIHNSYW